MYKAEDILGVVKLVSSRPNPPWELLALLLNLWTQLDTALSTQLRTTETLH